MKMFRDSSYPRIAKGKAETMPDAQGKAGAGAGARKMDMGDVATEARAEQSRRLGLPAPGAVDRAMEKGGKMFAKEGSRLARKGMLGPVSKAPAVAGAIDAVKSTVKKGVQALSDMREENKRRGPRNPKWMAEAADATVGNIARTAEVLPAQVGVGSSYKYKYTPPNPSGPSGGMKADKTQSRVRREKVRPRD